MNLGIVLGVSNYDNVSPLPGCLNDSQAVKTLLDISSKCSDILFLTEKTDSSSVKSKLTTFISKHENEEIDEVIFYFTGHGLFEEDEFYYILSDYYQGSKKQTSLENAELDELLKSLNAKLTVKIVDACQSGTRYVKDPEVFAKYLKNTEGKFNRCYFMFSSQNDQYSYQNAQISDFTGAFVNCFINRVNQEVRYKDIIDSISDGFSDNSKQTPYFVTQGNFTEIFGSINSDDVEKLSVYLSQSLGDEDKPADSHKSLLELVQTDAEKYCNEEDAIKSLDLLSKEASALKLNVELSQFYNISINVHTEESLNINTDYIGEHFDNNDTSFLVRVVTRREVRKVPRMNGVFGSIATSAALMGGHDIDMIDEYYAVPSGAKSTVTLPFSHIEIRLQSKFPNINDTGLVLIPYVSKTDIVVFHVQYRYRSEGWENQVFINSSCNWGSKYSSIKETSKINEGINEIWEKYQSYSLDPILKAFDTTKGIE